MRSIQHRCFGLGVFAALALFPVLARAQFEAGAFGGYHSFSEKNRLGRYDRDPRATAYSPSATLGVRLAYLPIRYVGGEMQISVVPTSTLDDRTSVTVVHGRVHLIGTLPLGKWRPFALLGVSAANAIPADPVYLRRATELNFHGGVGLRYDVQKLWGIRLDVLTAAVPRTDVSGFALEPSFLLGLYGNFPWPPAPPPPFDKDHDDITDDKDDCPDKAGEIRFGGCPDPDAKEEEAEEEEKPEEGAPKDKEDKDGKEDGKDGDAPKKDDAPAAEPVDPKKVRAP